MYLIAKVTEGGLMLISAILYYLIYISKIVPRFISVWGFIALVSLLIGNLLEVAGFTHPMITLFYPLIMVNEVFLAFWLMAKGFNDLSK